MKNFFLTFIFFIAISSAYAQTNNNPYHFPIKPGTEEWKKLKSGDEMASVCNIPETILKNLTTQALVNTCLNYPLFSEILSANDLQAGFSALQNNFNGFRELINRKDAGKELLLTYQKLNTANLSLIRSLEERGAFTFKFTYIELLLSQAQILSNLDTGEKHLLRQEALRKFEQKKNLISSFGTFGLNNSVWTLGKLLQVEGKQDLLSKEISKEDLNTFLSTGSFSTEQIVNAIYNVSKSL